MRGKHHWSIDKGRERQMLASHWLNPVTGWHIRGKASVRKDKSSQTACTTGLPFLQFKAPALKMEVQRPNDVPLTLERKT